MKQMRYLGILFSLYTGCAAAMLDSRVTLSSGGTVLPATTLSVSLNGLVPSATYSVICYIEASDPFQYIRLGSNLSDNTSTVAYYSLNGNVVSQAQLNIGYNIAVIVGNFTSPATSYLTLANLDQSSSFKVNSCFAMAVDN